MISSIWLKQTQDQILARCQSTYYTTPYHPSSEDELKWIDMGNHQGLAKENIVSQYLNRMNGS